MVTRNIDARLERLLAQTAARHSHLCPRQVLGVRLGLAGLRLLDLLGPEEEPFRNPVKRLMTIVETDGCGADGIAVATDCSVGRRTLRVEDYGKLAATLVDTHAGRAVRVWPRPDARALAVARTPDAESDWHAYLLGYQRLAEEELVAYTPVRLRRPLSEILSRPGARAFCARCAEEIMNEREVAGPDGPLCLGCAGSAYYVVEP